MADRSMILSELVDEYDIIVDDLSVWELINPSSSEDDCGEELGDLDGFSFTDEDLTSDEVLPEPTTKEEVPLEIGSPASDISMESLSAQLHQLTDGDVCGGAVVAGVAAVEVVVVDDVDDEYADKDHGGDDDEYDDYDEGYDLDDELVPWGMSDKFVRQRIRKLGKRVCPSKMNKAKRLPYKYNRPGCVYGKHGFGVQHSYI